jgi:hypothetical protein
LPFADRALQMDHPNDARGSCPLLVDAVSDAAQKANTVRTFFSGANSLNPVFTRLMQAQLELRLGAARNLGQEHPEVFFASGNPGP